MKTLSIEKLEEMNACSPGMEWFANQEETETKKVILKLFEEKKYNWSLWVITNLLTQEQNIKFSIFSAKLVLPIWETKYPDKTEPRLAIQAAEAYLLNPCKTTKEAAADAADAARAAYEDAYSKIINKGIELLGL